ncbi:MAG: hypothetical protein EP334_10035 [Gammaproteobacteria bacterium]|nr:MAG: hypothetical protein EP334_10035 [Gammaproteobacteria bacterium]
MGARVCIHASPSLRQQVRYGAALCAGFRENGYSVDITADPYKSAEFHVVLGPHYAKQQWIGHPRTILLDRCYYRGDPDHVSLGWLRCDGGRHFAVGEGRAAPVQQPLKTGKRTLFLADWGGPVEDADTIRYHPATGANKNTLEQDLAAHDIAIGYGTTALVAAALAGLRVVCKDARNIMSNPDWLALLPYADWGIEEIASGEAVAHLMESLCP